MSGFMTKSVAALAAEPGQPQDLKWFKEQMGVAPQYQESTQKILGMSWPHFLVMAFFSGLLRAHPDRGIRAQPPHAAAIAAAG